ncbi:hypothetical protein ADK76_03940 [Streptomyces griseoflavus]|uniref:hypothetical protein n=1 Tax=Streptomyces rimosus TaxID=1927 RepID=UPI0004C4CD29|nr:hypothetical protein [Streptomyces rimosus]KOG66009.1 hypothetical protein ADK76_03940 [Streptomyces griseoflavus]
MQSPAPPPPNSASDPTHAPTESSAPPEPSDPPEPPEPDGLATGGENDAARRRRRAQFLRDLNEAKELRDRVQPRRARAARMRQAMRMRTFRW